jgi:hypothetical protein
MIDKDRLEDSLYLMDKGVRDCCETFIYGTEKELGENLIEIEQQATHHNYYITYIDIHCDDDKDGKYGKSVFICKYQYQRIVISKLINDIKPHSFIYEYIMGSFLGYSGAAMEEFLMKHCTDEIILSIEENGNDEKI